MLPRINLPNMNDDGAQRGKRSQLTFSDLGDLQKLGSEKVLLVGFSSSSGHDDGTDSAKEGG